MTNRLYDMARSVFPRTVLAAAVLALCSSLAQGATAQKVRTWTDNTGKFKITAKFVEMAGDKVILEREDGLRVSVPLSRLSPADQKAAEAEARSPRESVRAARIGPQPR